MRLRILPLPEGAADERPPYLLVLDEVPIGVAEHLPELAPDTFQGCAGALVVHDQRVELPEVCGPWGAL